jgi:hypothetical protein
MSKLLRDYIRSILFEIQDYRVPNQLISKDGNNSSDKENQDSEKEMDEMSLGAGGIAGFTAPLGMPGEDLKNYKKKSKKPSWK